MSIMIFITCNGDGCDTALPVDAEDIISARIEARVKGWDTTRSYESRRREAKWVTYDQCPQHTVKKGSNSSCEVARRFSPEECVQGKSCPAIAYGQRFPHSRPVYDWCGHDQLGHRMANILLRDGFDTVKKIVAADAHQVLDLRGFGRMCVERWELFKEADTDG